MSLFRRPIKRPLPDQPLVLVVKHLRSALGRLPAARMHKEARQRLGELLRTALHAVLLLGVAVLLLLALAGDRGRFAILKLEASRSELKSEIHGLEAENRELELVVEQLRRPGFAAEKAAREVYGLVRPGELVYVDAGAPNGPAKQERREPTSAPASSERSKPTSAASRPED